MVKGLGILRFRVCTSGHMPIRFACAFEIVEKLSFS